MDFSNAPRLVRPAIVAKILGRNVRRLPELRRVDPDFPSPVRVGRNFMYREDLFLKWYGNVLKDSNEE